MEKIRLPNQLLYVAIEEMNQGLIDADLGDGLVKKRIAFAGKGKRNSIRVLVATNKKNCWVFLTGYKKNEKDNITKEEQLLLRELSLDYLSLSNEQLNYAVQQGELKEIFYEN